MDFSPEGELIASLLFMAGREDRLALKPVVDELQLQGVSAIYPHLKQAADDDARCDLLNRLLLTLGIKTVSVSFVRTVFAGVDFSKPEQIRTAVTRFRVLCLLDHGSFRHGFRQFRQGELIGRRWMETFPSPQRVQDLQGRLRARPAPAGLQRIPPDQLFSLGYLSDQYAATINDARRQLKAVLEAAATAQVSTFADLLTAGRSAGFSDFPELLSKAGVPGAERLAHLDLPLFSSAVPYPQVLREVAAGCTTMDALAIQATRKTGNHNSRMYMALHDLDVYVATSMREPLHFTSNWAFVQSLFHEGELAGWHLRYFDPTQSYLSDRIQKGLLECLMIKRAKLTVYNAQEEDTFGKDAEAGVTLAQKKPVIVYVARLFERELRDLYSAIDSGVRLDQERFVDKLVGAGLLTGDDRDGLLAPGSTKHSATAKVIQTHARRLLSEVPDAVVSMELIRQGYDVARRGASPKEFALTQMLKLERRALTFRDIHPLSLQTSPLDGVARGVIVTRSVEQTAQVIRGIFLGTLEFEIRNDEDNWLLIETITGSPVRVVTKDPILTTAFWTEDWSGEADSHPFGTAVPVS